MFLLSTSNRSINPAASQQAPSNLSDQLAQSQTSDKKAITPYYWRRISASICNSVSVA
jgi:hypothetical protein